MEFDLQPLPDVPCDAWPLPPAADADPDPREPLRQAAIHSLVAHYGYPQAWLGRRILRSDQFTGSAGTVPHEVCGVSLITRDGAPFLWLVVEEEGQLELAERRLRGLLERWPTSRAGLAIAGRRRRAVRRTPRGTIESISDISRYTRSNFAVNAAGAQALDAKLEGLFFDAASHIRDIDGRAPDEALDELCKLLLAKLYDEQAADGARLDRVACGSVEELAAEAHARYRQACQAEPAATGGDSPLAPLGLSDAAISRVLSVLEPYSLARSSADLKGRAFQRVLSPAMRAGLGQYFTPRELVELIVTCAQPQLGERVLDPFAGSGYFLTRAIAQVGSQPQVPDTAVRRWSARDVAGIEKSARMVRVAQTDLLLTNRPHPRLLCGDSLAAFSNLPDWAPASVDVILTNPPFGCLLDPSALRGLGAFELAATGRRVPLEVLGLERCVQLLKPGGRLAIVLPDGLLANQNRRDVRDWLARHVKLRAIISLPSEAFSVHGAAVKTSIALVRKWKVSESPAADYPVFLARIDRLGYDRSGRVHGESEVSQVAERVLEFLAREGW